MKGIEVGAVFYLETSHPAILDRYITIWTGLGGTGSFKNVPYWTPPIGRVILILSRLSDKAG